MTNIFVIKNKENDKEFITSSAESVLITPDGKIFVYNNEKNDIPMREISNHCYIKLLYIEQITLPKIIHTNQKNTYEP